MKLKKDDKIIMNTKILINHILRKFAEKIRESWQMKKTRLVILLSLILSLTGCIKEYKYTEEQTDIYAEYIAGVLLASDDNYKANLIPYYEIQEYEKEVALSTEAPTPTPDTADPTSIPTGDTDLDEMAHANDYTINDVIEGEDFDIQYTGYNLQGTYPENFMDAYFSITPSEGKQLLVMSFEFKNTSNKENYINLADTRVGYQLDVSDTRTQKPMLTLLENDLQYIKLNVDAGEKETAFLIFEVSNDIDVDEGVINLRISKDDKTATISLD